MKFYSALFCIAAFCLMQKTHTASASTAKPSIIAGLCPCDKGCMLICYGTLDRQIHAHFPNTDSSLPPATLSDGKSQALWIKTRSDMFYHVDSSLRLYDGDKITGLPPAGPFVITEAQIARGEVGRVMKDVNLWLEERKLKN